MKKKIIIAVLTLINITAIAQDSLKTKPTVEKSIFSVQTGFLGIWANHEAKLTNTIALRSEIGFDGGFWGGAIYPKTGYLFAPSLALEPRFYYNLGRRIRKGKSIKNNSANFISLRTGFHPDWFTISNYEGTRIVSDLSIIPTWGIRRHIGSHFNYEAGFGLGYRYFFAKSAGYSENTSSAVVNLHFRLGYTF